METFYTFFSLFWCLSPAMFTGDNHACMEYKAILEITIMRQSLCHVRSHALKSVSFFFPSISYQNCTQNIVCGTDRSTFFPSIPLVLFHADTLQKWFTIISFSNAPEEKYLGLNSLISSSCY